MVYKILLQYYKSTTPYYKVLVQYYSVLQSTTPSVLQSTTPHNKVILQYYFRTTQYYSSTTPYYKVLLQYYSVLQSTTPILLCTTKYYSSTAPYYRALLRPLKRRQNDVLPVLLRTTPVLQKLPKRAFHARLPQLFTEKASKMIVSCEASTKFHRTSFQNERFARCFRQFSQNKLPKGSFRARLLPNFTEQASKTSVLRDASDNFSQKRASKTSVSRDASDNFHEKICVSLQFRAIDTPLPARGFIRQKQNVPRTTTPCIPKFQNVRFATAACTKMYESIHREPTRFAHTKM